MLKRWAIPVDGVVPAGRTARKCQRVTALASIAAVVAAGLITTTVMTRPSTTGPSPLPADPSTVPSTSPSTVPSTSPAASPSISPSTDPSGAPTEFALLRNNRIIPAAGGPAVPIPLARGDSVHKVSRAAGGWIVDVGTSTGNVVRWLADSETALRKFPFPVPDEELVYSVQRGGEKVAKIDGTRLYVVGLPSLEIVEQFDVQPDTLSGGEATLVTLLDAHVHYRRYWLGDGTGKGASFVIDLDTRAKWEMKQLAYISQDGSTAVELRPGGGDRICFGVRTRSAVGPTVCPDGRSVKGVNFALEGGWILVIVSDSEPSGSTIWWYRTADVLANASAEPAAETGLHSADGGIYPLASRDGDSLFEIGNLGTVYRCEPGAACTSFIRSTVIRRCPTGTSLLPMTATKAARTRRNVRAP